MSNSNLSQAGGRCMSYCYLIQFSKAIGNPLKAKGQAQHYLGYTSRSIKARLQQNQSGTGAKITRAAVTEGADLILARTWRSGNRALERSLKRRHSHKSFCPVCGGAK